MKKVWLATLLLFALMITQVNASCSLPYPVMPDKESLVRGYCSRVVDGDTAYVEIVDDGIPVAHMYRLIGVDTPETVHPHLPVQPYGHQASAFTTQSLLNQWVYIEYDVQKTDNYKRHLCYAWLEDGSLFNLTLLQNGFGKFLIYPPNVKYSAFFLAAQKEAKNSQRGIWSPNLTINAGSELSSMTIDDLLNLKLRIDDELLRRTLP